MEEDESDLLNNLDNLNNSLRKGDKELFWENISNVYKGNLRDKRKKFPTVIVKPQTDDGVDQETVRHSRSLTYDTLSLMNIDLKNVEIYSENSYSTRYNSLSSILNNPILSQNVNLVDDVMKLIILGEPQVGKTLFIETTINESKYNSKLNYVHTNSLEIKKKLINLLGKKIKLELWDTNSQIIDSEIFQGKYKKVILAYLKICDGIILLIDPLRIESVTYIFNLMEKLIKFSSNNFYLVANVRFSADKLIDLDKIEMIKCKFKETDLYIKNFQQTYDVKVNYFDCSVYQIFGRSLNKFLCFTYIKKGIRNRKVTKSDKSKCHGVNSRRSCNNLTGS